MKRALYCLMLVLFLALGNQINLIADPGNAKPSQKQILFTQTTETPTTACPNGTQRFAAFCPFGTVLVSGQCTIDPPIQHISVNTPNIITLKPELHQDHNSSNDHGVNLGTTPHLHCDFECGITDTNEAIPVVSNDAVIIATILCAGTP